MSRLRSTYIEGILLLLWFLACLVIGMAIVHDYGMSIDEPNNDEKQLC